MTHPRCKEAVDKIETKTEDTSQPGFVFPLLPISISQSMEFVLGLGFFGLEWFCLFEVVCGFLVFWGVFFGQL